MALVRYYKFNGNLFDSVGGFDLTTRLGYVSYETGKLSYGAAAGFTGAYGQQWSAGASGAANNPVICANASEANSGVTDWTICFWLKVNNTGYNQNILTLSSAFGTSPITINYDVKSGLLQVNGSGISISGSTWYFICLRKTGSNIYYSIDAGAETTVGGTAGANYFNDLAIGGTTYFSTNYFTIDDLRIYNSLLTTIDRNAIYNSGTPSEAGTATPTAWQSPTHQHKLNGTLADSIGSVTATGTSVGYKGSGLFSASSNAVRLNSSGAMLSTSDANFAGGAKSSGSFSFFLWYLVGNPASSYPPANWTIGPLTHVAGPKAFQTTFYSSTVNDSNGLYSNCCLYAYNDIFQRLAIYGFDSNYNPTGTNLVVLAEIASARPAGDITGWAFDNGTSGGASATSDIDEVRFYPSVLTGGDYVALFNSGNGTEYAAGGVVNGSATGTLATVTMSALTAVGRGNASRSAGLSTVTVSGLPGSATGGATRSAGLSTVTMSTQSGGASGGGGTSVSASGLLATVTMSAQAGSANGTISVTASGGLGTVTVTAPLVPPKYLWKFQDTLTDSLRSKSLLATGNYTFESNPWSAANLGRSLKITSVDNSTNNQVEMHASLTGTEFDATNSANLSWTCCFWLKNPHQQVFYTPPYELFAYFNFAILNTQLSITRNLLSNNPATEFRIIWTSTAASQTTTYLQQYNQPNKTQATPDWFALTYDKVSGTFKIYTAAGGAITQAYSGTFATSSYRWNTPSYDLQFFHAWSLTPNQGNYIATGMDDLRLYDSALTAGELATIYNGGAGSVLPVSATASGTLDTVTMSAPSGTAAQGISGPLSTITMNPPSGFAVVIVNAAATGGLALITMSGPAGFATVTAGGNLPTITVTPPDAIARSFPSGSLPFVLMSPPTGSAEGSATKSGALGTVTLNAPAGTSRGGGTGTGGLSTITLSGLSGSAMAGTNGIGAMGTVIVSAITASAIGSATRTAALATVTLTSQAGAATGSAMPSSTLPTITLTGASGSATGSALPAGTLATLLVNTPTGTASANAVKAGVLGTITMSGPAGNATGMAPANGAFPPIAITAPAGSVTGNAATSRTLASVSLTPPGGAASGNSPAAGGLGTVTLSAPSTSTTGAASISATLPIIAVTAFSGSAGVSIVATGNMPVVTVSGPSAGATGQLVTQPFTPVIILPIAGSAIVISKAIGGLPVVTASTVSGNAIGTATGRPAGPIIAVVPPAARAYPGLGGTPVSVNTVDLPVLGS